MDRRVSDDQTWEKNVSWLDGGFGSDENSPHIKTLECLIQEMRLSLIFFFFHPTFCLAFRKVSSGVAARRGRSVQVFNQMF